MSSLGPAIYLGIVITDARRARGWPLRELARRAGLSLGGLHAIEHGRPASLRTYAAIGKALDREVRVELVDPRRKATSRRAEDPVHAAMGEVIAARMAALRLGVAIDEPYQHYQFAGRADVLAWDLARGALLHVENRTRFPNIQEAVGSYNAKRRYLPAVLAERLGLGRKGFSSVTNVIAGLWSSEVIHAARIRAATFGAVCPDSPAAFERWWAGDPPREGVTSAFVLLDPAPASPRQRPWAAVDGSTRPRYRGYADAAARVSRPASSRS